MVRSGLQRSFLGGGHKKLDVVDPDDFDPYLVRDENSGRTTELQSIHSTHKLDKSTSMNDVKESEAEVRARTRTPPARDWFIEILALTVAAGCIIAIAAILRAIDGTPLSSWHLFAQPNTVISILSTASKAALLLPVCESISQLKWLETSRTSGVPESRLDTLQTFDRASRGPWGSVRFLISAGRTSLLAYAACICVLLSLALDPFAQQLISYTSHSTRIPNQRSSVLRSQSFDNQFQDMHGASASIGTSRDSAILGAAIAGLYDLVAPPPFTCPSANCTFPGVASLGVCARCVDVTQPMVKSCANTTTGFYITSCNYTTPAGVNISAYSGADAHSGFGHTLINASAANIPDANETRSHLAAVGIVRFDDDNVGNSDMFHWVDTLVAYDCLFELCAQKYQNWTFASGALVPEPVQTSPLTYDGVSTLVLNFTTEASFPSDNSTFSANYYDIGTIGNGIEQIFKNQDYLNVLYNTDNSNDTVTIPNTVESMARGMSYGMMRGPNATEEYGDAFRDETFVRVNWGWLSLGVVLVVWAAALLGTTVWWSWRRGVESWKSSLVPLLGERGAKGRLQP